MKVRDLMAKDLVTIGAGNKVSEAIEQMNEIKVRYLPVIEEGKLAGVLTDGDILFRVYAHGLSPENLAVKDVMTKDVVTIGPDIDELQAMGLLAGHHVRRLPVIEGGKLVGVLSITDVESRVGMF